MPLKALFLVKYTTGRSKAIFLCWFYILYFGVDFLLFVDQLRILRFHMFS